MKARILVAGTGLMLAALLGGCASVKTATKLNGQLLTPNDTPIAHVNGSNWGIYWLPFVPLFTGSTEKPGDSEIFRDTVTVENVVDMTTARSRALGAKKTTDLQSSTTSILVFPIPPLLLWYKSVEVSGNAIQ